MKRIILLTAALAFASPVLAPGAFATRAFAEEAITADATINAIKDKAVNVSHGPIAAIGWPPMTMDLPLLEGTSTDGIKPGDKAVIHLKKTAGGMYGVSAIEKK